MTKISSTGTKSPTNQTWKDPFHVYSLSPHSPQFQPETHTKRHPTQQGCLPRLLVDGDKEIEKVYGEERNILYWAD
jgi:hypothetical protein